ncbi:GNAT family N-acetyltransferase [Thalassotalea piscium]
MKWHLITSIDKFNELSSSINALSSKSSNSQLFNSFAWYHQWLETFWQEEWQLQVYIAFDNTKPIALLPFYLQKPQGLFQLTTLLPLGQGEPEKSEVASEYTDIYIAEGYEVEVIKEFANKLQTFNIDQVIWRASLENSYISQLLKETFNYQTIATHARYIIDRPTWSLANLSKNTRSRYKRSVNQLNKIEAQFEWVNHNDYDKFTQILAEFHQTRWTNKGSAGAFAEEKFNIFHQCFRNNNNDNIRISAIIVNHKPIAINYYLADETTLYFYQCGWDEINYANLSPGFALHLWSIEQCPLKYYDFMMGGMNDSYKAKFGCKKTLMVSNHVIINSWKYLLNKIINKLRIYVNKQES